MQVSGAAIGGLGALALIMAGCAAPPPRACAGISAIPMVQVQLLFGLGLPQGGLVPESAWRDFVAGTITPLFPDGLTVLTAEGQWRDWQDGHVGREPSRVVTVVTPGAPDLAMRLAATRDAYRRAFRQQSVGVVLTQGCAAF